MSRTRIVKGDIIKIVGGDYKRYSKDEIENIGSKVIQVGKEGGVSYGTNEAPPEMQYNETPDFDIELELIEKDFVPLGIPSYKGKAENSQIQFKMTIKGNGINQWNFIIKNKDHIIYQCFSSTEELAEVVITAKGKTPKTESNKSTTTHQSIIKRYWPAGEYIISWSGFDKNGIYDSVLMKSEEGLMVSITGQAEFKRKTYTIEKPIRFTHKEVDWVDVKIDKKNKRINTTLRVDLRDGGAKGLECSSYLEGARDETRWKTICPWDKIPSTKLINGKPPIKVKTRSFGDLEKLAIDGINKHWSRIGNYSVEIESENYQIITSSINTNFKSLNPLDLIFNTNENWGRSGNAGVLGKIYYNVGYCNFLDWYQPSFVNEWGYLDAIKNKVDEDFMYTSAHELGHTILRAYGGIWYSFTHDDSSEIWQTPNGKKSYPQEKSTGEINLMHYFKDDPYQSQYDFNLIMASKEDIVSLIWLTKIKIN